MSSYHYSWREGGERWGLCVWRTWTDLDLMCLSGSLCICHCISSWKIVLCHCTGKKTWKKGPPRARRTLTGFPHPTPTEKEAGSWWKLEAVANTCWEELVCFWHSKKCRTKGHVPANMREVWIYQVERFRFPRRIKSSERILSNVENPAGDGLLSCTPHGKWLYSELRKVWINKSAEPRNLFCV